MRSLSDLQDVENPAWPDVLAAIEAAELDVNVIPVDRDEGERTLVHLQVTTRSVLGALAIHTGGLLVDHGWLRILGGGPPPMNLAIANALDQPRPPGLDRMLVAFDALGGSYAINGGGLPGAPGGVCYFAPDSLAWEPLGFGHAAFVTWSMTERFAAFSADLRWPGWEHEVDPLTADLGIGVFPPPFTKDGKDISQVSRRVVPIVELLGLWHDLADQLDGLA